MTESYGARHSAHTTFYVEHPHVLARPCFVYRIYADTGELLYIGSANDVRLRLMDHQLQGQRWFPLAHRVDVDEYATQREARAVEKAAVLAENPLGNVVWTERQRKDVPSVDPLILRMLEERGLP